MGRSIKQGLDYFSLSTSYFFNTRESHILRHYGPAGSLIILFVLTRVFHNSYYVEYDGILREQVAFHLSVDETLVDEVIQRAIELGIFDRGKFDNDGILTSEDIQENYIFATDRRKCQIDPAHLLVDADACKRRVAAKNKLLSSNSATTRKKKTTSSTRKTTKKLTLKSLENNDENDFDEVV
jgi:hypothetical protein